MKRHKHHPVTVRNGTNGHEHRFDLSPGQRESQVSGWIEHFVHGLQRHEHTVEVRAPYERIDEWAERLDDLICSGFVRLIAQ